MHVERQLLRVRERPQIAREFAEGCPAIARLNGRHRRTQLRRIRDHLRESLHVARKRDHLRLIIGLQPVHHLQRFVLGVGKPVARPHTEGAIHGDHRDFLSVRGSGRPPEERAREQQGQQNNHRRAQSEQQ